MLRYLSSMIYFSALLCAFPHLSAQETYTQNGRIVSISTTSNNQLLCENATVTFTCSAPLPGDRPENFKLTITTTESDFSVNQEVTAEDSRTVAFTDLNNDSTVVFFGQLVLHDRARVSLGFHYDIGMGTLKVNCKHCASANLPCGEYRFWNSEGSYLTWESAEAAVSGANEDPELQNIEYQINGTDKTVMARAMLQPDFFSTNATYSISTTAIRDCLQQARNESDTSEVIASCNQGAIKVALGTFPFGIYLLTANNTLDPTSSSQQMLDWCFQLNSEDAYDAGAQQSRVTLRWRGDFPRRPTCFINDQPVWNSAPGSEEQENTISFVEMANALGNSEDVVQINQIACRFAQLTTLSLNDLRQQSISNDGSSIHWQPSVITPFQLIAAIPALNLSAHLDNKTQSFDYKTRFQQSNLNTSLAITLTGLFGNQEKHLLVRQFAPQFIPTQNGSVGIYAYISLGVSAAILVIAASAIVITYYCINKHAIPKPGSAAPATGIELRQMEVNP